jgi:hypothetical protein
MEYFKCTEFYLLPLKCCNESLIMAVVRRVLRPCKRLYSNDICVEVVILRLIIMSTKLLRITTVFVVKDYLWTDVVSYGSTDGRSNWR